MSLSQITRIKNAKNAIATAISDKGVTVPAETGARKMRMDVPSLESDPIMHRW